MDNRSITNFNALLTSSKPEDKSLLLSVAYDPKSSRQDLQHAIYAVAKNSGLSINDDTVDHILDTAPKGELHDFDRSLEEIENEKPKDEPHSGAGGTMINHEKYQSEIVDAVAKEHELQSLKILNDIRNDATLSAEEKKLKLTQAFESIAKRNANAEGTTNEQIAILTGHLSSEQTGITTPEGKVAAAVRLQNRAEELSLQRTKDREELATLQKSEVAQKQLELENAQTQMYVLEKKDKRQLTLEEQERLKTLKRSIQGMQTNLSEKNLSREDRDNLIKFQTLRANHTQRDALSQHHIDVLVHRFSSLSTAEQDLFLKKFLARQQRFARKNLWELFDQKEKGKLTRLYKKTLSRKERHKLLASQRANIQQYSSIDYTALNRFLNSFSQMSIQIPQSGGYIQQQDSSGASGPVEFMDNVNRVKNTIDRVQNIAEWAKNLFSGGGAGAGGAGAAGATTAATATSPFWGTALLVIGVVLIVIILLFVIIMLILGNHNPGAVPSYSQIDCNDQTIKPEDIDTGDRMIKIIASRFHITVPSGVFYSPNKGSGKNVDPTKASPTPELVTTFSSICRLFGHVNGISFDNSFGRLFTSHFNNVDQNILNFSGDSSNKCSLDTESAPGSILHFTIKNPLKCTQAELEFYIDKGLAFALAGFLQADGKGVLKDFTNAVYKTPPKLPTAGCQSPGTKSGFNKEDYCFADMVASYATWGFPFVSASGSALLDKSATGSATTTGIIYLLAGIGNFPDTYQLYYKFAHDELFNGVDFWNTNSFLGSKLDEFVEDVKSCQGPNGDSHTPDRGCINQLRADADPDFEKALTRVWPDYQCGAFVWSYEDLYGWPEMRGNGSGGVSGWYWLGPTQQKGFHWFQNPYHGGTPATIQPGDIIVYATDQVNSGDVGHVAVVKSVDKDNFHFTVQESNYHLDANHKALVSDTRIVTLDQYLRKNAIQGWWRSDTLISQPKQTQ